MYLCESEEGAPRDGFIDLRARDTLAIVYYDEVQEPSACSSLLSLS